MKRETITMFWPRKKNRQNEGIKKGIRIKIHGKESMGQLKRGCFSQVLEDSKNRGENWQEIKR
jgi:hypothetical protein